jgi:hypothetical protein
MVPLTSAVMPPDIPFSVVFCIGVGWIMKSSMCGVTQQDAPESIIAFFCETCVSCYHDSYFKEFFVL